MSTDNPYVLLAYRRALTSGDPALVQISFDAAVLEKYRGAVGYSLIRTDTAGRVKREGGWTLDAGIAEDGSIHASLGDLLQQLPEEEREHWAQHVVSLPLSANFLAMRLRPNSCFDDGEVRAWD
jgi:hypothetical protein